MHAVHRVLETLPDYRCHGDNATDDHRNFQLWAGFGGIWLLRKVAMIAPPTAPPASSPLLPHYAHSLSLMLLVLVCMSTLGGALSGGDWMNGDCMRDGQVRLAVVGLTEAWLRSGPSEAAVQHIELDALCEERAIHPSDTPSAVWCAQRDVGVAVARLLEAAWLPALMVLGTSVLSLCHRHAPSLVTP